MPRLIVQDHEQGGAFDLNEGRFRIGRGRHCDIQIEDASISEVHCEVYIDALMVQVVDLGSTNGTFIDGFPIQKAELASGQVLHVGRVAMILERETQRIFTPEIPNRAREVVTHVANGNRACQNHQDREAKMQCPQCQKYFCGSCIRAVGLVGARKHLLCPSCHQHCVVYHGEAGQNSKPLLAQIWNKLRKITRPFRN